MKAKKAAILTVIGVVMTFILPSVTVICVATIPWWFLGVPIFVGGAFMLTFGILGLKETPRTESPYRDYGKWGKVVVIEQKPMIRTTLWEARFERTKIRRLVFPFEKTVIRKLAFPYVIFVISLGEMESRYYFRDMYVYYRNEPLKSKSDMLYRPNLPNISHVYRVCMGGVEKVKRSQFPFQVAREAIEVFWGSEFNSDMSEFFEAGKWLSRKLVSLRKWKKASKKNSSFPLEIQWRKACTLSEAIRRAG